MERFDGSQDQVLLVHQKGKEISARPLLAMKLGVPGKTMGAPESQRYDLPAPPFSTCRSLYIYCRAVDLV